MLRKILALATLVMALASCGADTGVTVLRVLHPHDGTHPVHHALVYMDEQLRELSGGSMRVDIYTSAQLGSERESVELLQLGSLAMTKISTSVLDGFAPSFRVFGLPFLFRDDEHRLAVMDGPIGRDLLGGLAPFRLRGLTYYDAGARSFYTASAAVQAPADLAGLKIRTQESAMAIRMVSALGGAPTPMAFGEVYTAMQQGVVDGAENNPPSFYLTRHYEVSDYYILDEHTAVPDILLMSEPVWDRLTPEQQGWVQAAADASAQYQKELWRQATEEALREVQAAGVEIIRPDKAAFRDAVEPLLSSFREDPATAALIRAIEEVE